MQRALVVFLVCMAAFAAMPPTEVLAFCGFYVAPGDQKLVNNATRVALMRHDETTVISLQPDYQGPAKEFAMVVPVPQVLQKKQVKTLDRSLFDTLDTFTSPRMSEYWEQDPCPRPEPEYEELDLMVRSSAPPRRSRKGAGKKDAYVVVKAKFAVGEYDIVILDSNDATALEQWLVKRKYKIPKGAAPYLAPYIQGGMYFFVAKVDPKRAKFQGNQAILSPLRFHYRSKDFTLPIRLGMINAGKEQDIVVFVLAEDRYVPSNYPHAPIATNIVVKNAVRNNFAGFYEGLFAETRKKNEDAIITEYVWELATVQPRGGIRQGPKCDPCTSPVQFFTPQWMLSLGLDVFGVQQQPQSGGLDILEPQPRRRGRRPPRQPPSPIISANAPKKIVVTRLHGRFKPATANPDIMFQKAEPIVGGMGTPDPKGNLQPTQFHPSQNRFQGRYVILHKWKGKAICDNPQYGYWGGPPNGAAPQARSAGGPAFGGKKPKSVPPARYAKSKIEYAPPKKK